MSNGKGIVSYKSFSKYLLTPFSGLLYLRKIIREINPNKLITGNPCGELCGTIHIHNLPTGADRDEGVKACLNEISGIERGIPQGFLRVTECSNYKF